MALYLMMGLVALAVQQLALLILVDFLYLVRQEVLLERDLTQGLLAGEIEHRAVCLSASEEVGQLLRLALAGSPLPLLMGLPEEARLMAAVVAVVAARSQGIPLAVAVMVAMALFILWSGK